MRVTPVAVATSLALLAACSDNSSPPVGVGTPPASLQTSASPETNLARLVALALREPSARAALHRASSASPVKEGKLHLSTYLRSAQGKPLMLAMSRAGVVSESYVSGLLSTLPNLEMYLPFDAHRARWRGGNNLLVAIQLEEFADALAFGLDGRALSLPDSVEPATPTIALVPAESFDATGFPYTHHLARGMRADVNRGGARNGLSASADAAGEAQWYEGMWITEMHIPGDYEGAFRGDPEYEMFLENNSTNPRSTMVCTGNNSVAPYRWNMDGKDFTNDWLQAQQYEMGTNVPSVLSVWEDDDTSCKIVQDKDYVKLATDAITNAAGAYKAIKRKQFENGQFLVKLYHAFANTRAIIKGEDEFVGVSAGLNSISSTPQRFELKDRYMQNKGWFVTVWQRRCIGCIQGV